MEKLTKIWIGVIILAVIVLGILYTTRFNGNSVKEDKPVVKIGVIVPLTGESSFMGIGYQNSIAMAKEKLKDTKYDYQLIYEDDKNFDSKEASSAIQKLISIDNVNAVITLSSGTGNVVSPITQQNKIVHIGFASDPNVAKGKYNFVAATTPQEENRALIQELQKRGIKKIAILFMNQEGGVAILNDLNDRIKGTDIQIVSQQKFNTGTKDFKSILLKAEEDNPDIYLLYVFSPDLEIIAKQARELGITKLTSIEAFEFTTQPQLFEGLWYISQADATREFKDAYESKYNVQVPFGAPNAYDQFNLIVDAFENAGSPGKMPSSDEVANYIANLKSYQGALGTLNTNSNHLIESKASVKEIINGKYVTLESS